MTRRGFLNGFLLGTTVLALVPASALAQSSASTTTITMGKDAAGRYSVPTDIAANMNAERLALIEAKANAIARVAQAEAIGVAEGGGMLTRFAAPLLGATSRGGLVGGLVGAGLLLGLTWALSNATIDLSTNGLKTTIPAQACAALPAAPSSILDVGTGIYKSSNSTLENVYMTQFVSNPSGGSVAAPSGWSNIYQGSPSNGLTRVVFSPVPTPACGSAVTLPTVPGSNANDAVPKANQNEVVKPAVVADIANAHAKNTDTQAVSGPDIVDPGASVASPSVIADDVPTNRAPTIGNYTSPWSAVSTAGTPEFVFPAGDSNFPDVSTNPGNTDPGSSSGGSSSGPVEVDWGTPPASQSIVSVDPMSWMPTPFTAPDLPGQCTAFPVDFKPAVNWSGSLDPCPVLVQARPIVRPVAIAGWTVRALVEMLDL